MLAFLPSRPSVFCHNDTYHGNVFLLDDGRVRLLDFEFSCRNHIAFDFANLFAETVMEHGLPEPPHFRIAEPRFTDDDLASLIGCYLDNVDFDAPGGTGGGTGQTGGRNPPSDSAVGLHVRDGGPAPRVGADPEDPVHPVRTPTVHQVPRCVGRRVRRVSARQPGNRYE